MFIMYKKKNLVKSTKKRLKSSGFLYYWRKGSQKPSVHNIVDFTTLNLT